MPEGPPGAHGPIDLKKINPYIYAPSFSMAVFGSAMFTISLVISTFQIFKYKCWYFNIMPQAILLDVIAMVARTHSIIYLKETGATGPYIIGQTVIGIAPTLVAIGTIFTMTRLVWWVTPNERRNLQTLMAPPKMISFMWAGFVSICDISKAVGQMGFPHGHPTGTKIMQIATVVQFFVYAGYAVWALRFMMISRRWVIHHDAEAKNWRSLGWSVVLASVMLAARHVFTIIASDAQGDRAAFYSLHEWVFWMTQMFPLFAVYTIFNIFHPGQFLPRDYTRFRLKLKEIEKMKNDNPWPTTISAPIYRPENDKGMEITLTELENGAQHRR
ncbi:hypothetical protein EJ06DRAFT_518806 [Trichodelitschia bisporula]|uniref:RTA1-domain-containing protein n=1 Tax=Trichodelitschia bisporula TaxID=703511 RepID=A0A6G1I871_9PEZI|nr:hypothetical protein EJ06DRAFT_518806 [Trichodelitschia bisporula]